MRDIKNDTDIKNNWLHDISDLPDRNSGGGFVIKNYSENPPNQK